MKNLNLTDEELDIIKDAIGNYTLYNSDGEEVFTIAEKCEELKKKAREQL